MDDKTRRAIMDIQKQVSAITEKLNSIDGKVDRAFKDIGRNEASIKENKERIYDIDRKVQVYIAKAGSVFGIIYIIIQLVIAYI